MRKKFILFPFVLVLLYVALSSYQEGPAQTASIEGTGATGAPGCSCHNPTATVTTGVTLQLLDAGVPVTNYVGGHTYTVRITGTQTSGSLTLPKFGFQLAVVKASGAGTGSAVNAGTFSAPPAGTHLFTLGSLNIFEHGPTSLVASTGTGGAGTTYVESITWTAPVAGTGNINIYGTINAVNGNGAADSPNDKWNSASVVISELQAITGTATVCVSGTTPLSDATSGGTWSSSATSIATVGSAGIVTGVAAGTATISYIAGGSAATRIVTVNGMPTITPGSISTICAGTSAILPYTATGSPATYSITWAGSPTGIPNVAPGTTLPSSPIPITVLGSAVGGTYTGTITATNGCGSSVGMPVTLTVNVIPAVAVSGIPSVCACTSSALSYSVTAGLPIFAYSITWTGSPAGLTNIPAGTLLPASPLSIPVGCSALGTTYGGILVVTNACGSSAPMSIGIAVGAPPSPAAITGTAAVCSGGATTTLSDATTGGSWSSTNTAAATISSAGVVTGVAAGTTTISYTMTNSCGTTAATVVVTVNTLPPTPASITGTVSVCAGGATTSLNDATPGGTWTSTNTTAATVSSAGVVTGAAAGTTTISYTISNSCGSSASTAIVTVNPSPANITGILTVCQGLTTTLSDGTAGGSWASSNTSVALISTAGVATGVLTGAVVATAMISYILPTGCYTTAILTVNHLPSPIIGPSTVCATSTACFTDASVGGSWSSTMGTVDPVTGCVIAGIGGTAVITYTLPTGCITTTLLTVNPLPATPAAIGGTGAICAGGATNTLSESVSGGTWSSTNTAVATVGSTGIVTSAAAGTTTISYTITNGCGSVAATKIVTVNPVPPNITGTLAICDGFSTPLSDGTAGGSWASSSPVVSIVSTTGFATGDISGTATITYTLFTGCYTTAVLTVNPLPGGITGSTIVCAGSTTGLFDGSAGGSWTSSNTAIATVGSFSGLVTGIAAGSATMIYTLATSCSISAPVTVNSSPTNITGTFAICQGSSTTLSDALPSGSWMSDNVVVASVGVTTGIAIGTGLGTATITYTLPTGCYTTAVLTVNPMPGTLSGTTNICAGATTTLTATPPGGSWSSSNTSVATVGSSSGVITGIAGGSATITYALSAMCSISVHVTVNTVPAPITGSPTVCAGATTSLGDVTAGGSFSSTNTAVGDISSGGTFTGFAAGTTTISYTVTNSCGTVAATIAVTVDAAPDTPLSIFAPFPICVGGDTSSFYDGTPGGIWSSTNTVVATIGSTGILNGLTIGITTISYTITNSCGSQAATTVVSVNAAPTAIAGNAEICIGGTSTLSDGVTGGTWSSGALSVANVGVVNGIVFGVSPGTATIIYTVVGGCISTMVITVLTPSACASLGVNTGIAASESDIIIYPNPSSGSFTIELPEAGREAEVTIVDVFGKTVQSGRMRASEMQFGLTNQAAGSYFVRMITKDATYVKKLTLTR